jgi:hypothetical protein
MTAISQRKTVIRAETSATMRSAGRYRPIMIELTAYTVRLREKGRRQWFETSWEAVFWQAVKKKAEADMEERKAKRRKRR